ncbi:Butyryl-CoA dehydrogenase [Labilithrix luteola]|uniref:Cyclohex-1-ene-1-carbonyl-CoA dehydrogenase n=1 Tax=Labilithrix luteola TaxID=1391654 RepID=A0A0K1PZU8_9BACT|nr:acyl-CoA dehydrogenase family protein [Labilithrix luteola]AKU99017.1 Butyryl-CoA dehydrogenase [Labilithrix luteola]
MDFSLNETQTMVQKAARDYATRVIMPEASAIDKEERFPREILKGLADLGLMAVNVPEEFGGAQAGPVAYALAMQEVARACASTAVTMAVTNMVGEVIATFGTPEQKANYCPKLASGEYVAGSFGLSEPEAGSDPGSMRTTARKEGDSWVIDGQKQWITSGAHAGVIVVWARTGEREKLPGTRGVSCFLVEGGTPGLKIGKAEDKMGIRGSNTVSLSFENCRVPESALLGELNGGFKIAMMALDGGRIGISSQAIGIARAALEEAVQYAKDRKQFGKSIGEFQAIQWKLADMKLALDSADLLAMRAAWLKEQRRPFSREASMAKLFATEAANRIANENVQIHGGYGYTREFAAERHVRDARVTTIYEGTSEVQRIVIARSTLA